MTEVGELQHGDLRYQVTRRTAHYRDALLLARHILVAQGRTIRHGEAAAWVFLIRTPEMVEEGIRQILAKELGDRWEVRKGKLTLSESTMTLNPDLVFDYGQAVADVKYKICQADWKRSDLYQIVTFAEGYDTAHGAVINFQLPQTPSLPHAHVGNKRIVHLPWPADAELEPHQVAKQMSVGVAQWLESVCPKDRLVQAVG